MNMKCLQNSSYNSIVMSHLSLILDEVSGASRPAMLLIAFDIQVGNRILVVLSKTISAGKSLAMLFGDRK